MKRNNDLKEPSGPISYGRLVFQAIPELFSYQMISGILLAIATWGLYKLINLVAESGGAALTTANLTDLLLSWRGLAILLLGVVLVAVFAAFEIFASIYLYDDILNGRTVRIFAEIGKGFRALRRFLCPGGFLVLLYIFIAVPLCGIGFSISLTENFYIPNFIMEVVCSTPLYNALYWIVMLALLAVGLGGVFTLHGVLLDGMKPKAAFAASWRLWKKNWKNFVPAMALTFVVLLLILITAVFLQELPMNSLEAEGASLPRNYRVDSEAVLSGNYTDTDLDVIVYRAVCALVVLDGGFLLYLLSLLASSCFMLRFTRCYLEYTRDLAVKWPSRSKRRGYGRHVLLMILTLVLLLLLAALIGLGFDDVVHRAEPVRIVAHRTGGVMAPENSLEGLELAIEHNCFAAETDTQRTKDGYYIINHDDDYKRLTGVAKKPGDLTLEETMALTITDPFTGAKAPVPKLDEMLDLVKGRITLFLELKGVSADKQMVDDVVKLIREKDCVENVTLISLKYDIIDYAETKYPEFNTGVLMFGGLGDVARINCDLLILEEEMSTNSRIDSIHESGKEVYVWTINTEQGMHKFLDSHCDGIITDQIEMAERVKAELANRTDLQLLQDKLVDLWE